MFLHHHILLLTLKLAHCTSHQELEVPVGPDSLAQLFDWSSYYTDTLFVDNHCVESFKALVESTDIKIFDYFAGSGNASTSMKQQYQAMAHATGFLVN